MSRNARPIVAFSTLACPEWSAETVVRRAAAIGFDGVEWRGGPDGTVQTGWSQARRHSLRRATEDSGLTSIAVTAYTNLVSGDAAVARRSVDEAAAHAVLGADIGAPVVRVFLGVRDDDAPEAELARRAAGGLSSLLDRTRSLAVTIAIEPHDDHVRASTVRPILDAVDDPGLNVIWDVANAWSAGESPADGLAAYDGRIAYVQVKDGTGLGPTWRLCALGRGTVPLDDALNDLVGRSAATRRPVPPVSVEWERAWHDHLEPAEIALPAAHRWLRNRIDRAIAGDDRATGSAGTAVTT